MAYERINWQNEPSEATALNDVNLNKMDSAIYELDGKATTTETAITNLQDGKVDKVNGKGLSQVDNVTVTQHVAYGTVVSTIKTYGQDGTEVTSQVCNGVVVDSAMSSSSTNPVQNKVVASAIDDSVNWSRKTTSGTRILELTKKTTDGSTVNYDIYNGVVVDNAISSSSENPVENKAIYDALNNLLPSKTVSGNPISISDASGFDAKELTVTMNPIQSGSGDPSPTNIRPISGRTEASVTRTGKNLFNASTVSLNCYVSNSTGNLSSHTGSVSSDYIEVEGGQTYRISPVLSSGNWGAWYDENKAYISGITGYNEKKTAPSNAKYMRFTVSYGNNNPDYATITQVEIGSEVTSYEPYTAETKTHQYSETIYGGVDDFVNGGLSNEYELFEPTTVTTVAQSSGLWYWAFSLPKTSTNPLSTNGLMSSHFNPTNQVLAIGNCYITANGTLLLCVPSDQTLNTGALVNAWLAENDLQFAYKPTTPTTISTSAEEITLLKGNNVLSTNADDMELKYSVSLDSLLPTTTRTLAKSVAPIEEEPIVEEPKEETDETEEQR